MKTESISYVFIVGNSRSGTTLMSRVFRNNPETHAFNELHFFENLEGRQLSNADLAKKFFDIGFTVSFTGVITFAKDYEEVVKSAPLDMIHAETDCPFVAPSPYRGKRAEPWMVKEVYKKIAEIRSEDEEVVRAQLVKNASSLYFINQ